MTKIILLTAASALFCLQATAQQEKTFSVEVHNTWHKARTDVPVVIKLNEIAADFPAQSAIVKSGEQEIPAQADDLDNDGTPNEVVFLIDLPANASREYTVTLSEAKSRKQYTPRVFAEMLVSDKNGRHVPIQSLTVPGTSNVYNQLHHHGPAFESELVAYRIYFDRKQTVDIYGKFNKGFEIEESQFYPTDEQLARGFGDDVLRVGNSCGVGALKGWDGTKATHIEPVATRTERIVSYGPLRTVVDVEVSGWQYRGGELCMTNRYILYGGHRDILIETHFAAPLKDEIFCTGVQDIKGSVSYSDHEGLTACWGTDWPVNDTVKYVKETVGLAAYIPAKYVVKEAKDKDNHLYTLTAGGENCFRYYATFTSMKETFGYKTPEEWFGYVREWKEELEHPVRVIIRE